MSRATAAAIALLTLLALGKRVQGYVSQLMIRYNFGLCIAIASRGTATLICKCANNYLSEATLEKCDRTTSTCERADACGLSATQLPNGIVQMSWFCLYFHDPTEWFSDQSFCHGAGSSARTLQLCCSNYSMCNEDLNATFPTPLSPTAIVKCACG